MNPKKETNKPGDKVSLYDKLIATHPEIDRKGDTNPYTSYNGNMFTILLKKRSVRHTPSGKREIPFYKKYKTNLLEAYGAVMKEYVVVPDPLLKKTTELKKWLAISYEYIKTLKPKPTKKIKNS